MEIYIRRLKTIKKINRDAQDKQDILKSV